MEEAEVVGDGLSELPAAGGEQHRDHCEHHGERPQVAPPVRGPQFNLKCGMGLRAADGWPRPAYHRQSLFAIAVRGKCAE